MFAAPLSPWSVVPAVIALVAYALAWPRGDSALARRALPLAWIAHGTALFAHLLGIGLPGDGIRFGFAPALSSTVWLVLAVHAIESRFVPVPAIRRLLAALGGLAVLIGLLFPGEGAIHAVSPWAPLHWLMGFASYGLFGAAVLHAIWLDRAERAMRSRKTPALDSGALPLLRLEQLTFRFVAAGFVVLSAAIVLGSWFMAAWRWDHKTLFSLMGWAVFAGLLGGRRAFGWRGRRATRWLYLGSVLLLLAYIGSRFVFEVLLHRPVAITG
ncbi:cytochrome C assembly family protein [Leptothrix discophora]|uniref:Cytochrome c biogenesis protein CcsA n=1 Tax=Leptothrix discophora TaxID=89 RepID=A0ABT9G743_LEPDI|nr:cytochrome c biogenesis protein CcsA [Leptothrix discophora]MDP4302304.1 cytochrome c biogenesis protein CcsA [Leptothrix discophora]